MTGWIVVGVLGVAAAVTGPKMPRWLYHWRHAAHIVELTQSEPVPAPEYLPAPMPGGCTCGVQSGEHKLWCGDELPPPLEAVLRRELHHVDAYEPGADPVPAHGLGLDTPGEGVPGSAHEPVRPTLPPIGAGDESEACGPPAPPAPPGAMSFILAAPTVYEIVQKRADVPHHLAAPADVENARVDAFIAEMRADMAAWLASARERWAAA